MLLRGHQSWVLEECEQLFGRPQRRSSLRLSSKSDLQADEFCRLPRLPVMNINTRKALPQVVSRAEWLTRRKQLLAAEKEVTKARDAVAARRRRLPWSASRRATGSKDQTVWSSSLISSPGTASSTCTTSCGSTNRTPAARAAPAPPIGRSTKRISPRCANGTWHSLPWPGRPGRASGPTGTSGDGRSRSSSSARIVHFNHDFHVTMDETRVPIEYNYPHQDRADRRRHSRRVPTRRLARCQRFPPQTARRSTPTRRLRPRSWTSWPRPTNS